EAIAGYYARVLAHMAHTPAARYETAALLAPAERTRHLDTWNATSTPLPAGATIPAQVAQQVARTPDAVALHDGTTTLTYAALDAAADHLAGVLRRHWGVTADVPVGLCLERSAALVVGMLGILKAGGAYVPLDPTYPAERLAWMRQDAA